MTRQRFVRAATLAVSLLAAAPVAVAAEDAASAGERAEAAAMPEGNARRGMMQYQMSMCHSCHSLQGLRRKGPHLFGIVGREAGALEGYDYSKGLAEADFTWTEETLFAFLERPKRMFPNTKMSWPGMRNPQKRADIVAFLKAFAEQRRKRQ